MIAEAEAIDRARSLIHSPFPQMVLVLGSGWDSVIKDVKVTAAIPFSDLFGVKATVPGHEGKLVLGDIAGGAVGFMSGRIHMYEGYTAREATLPIRVFAALGMKELVLTSASGGLNKQYRVGDLVILSDVLTIALHPDTPLIGPEFVDMSEVFDPELRQRAIAACQAEKMTHHEGVYAYMHGPQFETPSDKRALQQLGADCVGMSTVPEVIMARARGVRVLGLSLVTNLAFVKHDHTAVLAAAQAQSIQLSHVVRRVITGEK